MHARQDSNLQPTVLETDALPIAPLPYGGLLSGWRESDPRCSVGNAVCYHYNTPAGPFECTAHASGAARWYEPLSIASSIRERGEAECCAVSAPPPRLLRVQRSDAPEEAAAPCSRYACPSCRGERSHRASLVADVRGPHSERRWASLAARSAGGCPTCRDRGEPGARLAKGAGTRTRTRLAASRRSRAGSALGSRAGPRRAGRNPEPIRRKRPDGSHDRRHRPAPRHRRK